MTEGIPKHPAVAFLIGFVTVGCSAFFGALAGVLVWRRWFL